MSAKVKVLPIHVSFSLQATCTCLECGRGLIVDRSQAKPLLMHELTGCANAGKKFHMPTVQLVEIER